MKKRDLIKPFSIIRAYSRKKYSTFLLGAITLGLFLFLLPQPAFKAGNLFFGGIQPLYNITFSKALFLTATHPVLGNNPPQFAHYQLSRIYFIEGNHYRAIDEAKKELALYPDSVTSYYILGLAYGYLNRTHEAIEYFSKYVEAHPDTWAGRNDMAWLQFRIGDINGALKTIKPVVLNYPNTPWIQNTYCTLLINTNEFKKALEVCDRAKILIYAMTPEDWGRSYPGNDSRIYDDGLEAMKKSVSSNIAILEGKMENGN